MLTSPDVGCCVPSGRRALAFPLPSTREQAGGKLVHTAPHAISILPISRTKERRPEGEASGVHLASLPSGFRFIIHIKPLKPPHLAPAGFGEARDLTGSHEGYLVPERRPPNDNPVTPVQYPQPDNANPIINAKLHHTARLILLLSYRATPQSCHRLPQPTHDDFQLAALSALA